MMHIELYGIILLLSISISYMIIPFIVRISFEKNLLDNPNFRKLNRTSIPNLGGVAIFAGIALSSLLVLPDPIMFDIRFLEGAVLILFFLGLADDILNIPARKKLFIQIIVAYLLVYFGKFQIASLSNILLINQLNSYFSFWISFFFIIFIINAMNLIDGIDGLAGTIGIIIFSFFGIWLYNYKLINYSLLCIAAVGSIIGFLKFNLSKGKLKIFMGDTGSLIIGVLIAAVSIKLINTDVSSFPDSSFNSKMPLFIFALLIVPISDTLRVFIIRIYQGKSPFSADKNHIHHILIDLKLTHVQSSLVLASYTLLFTLYVYFFKDLLDINLNFAIIGTLNFSIIQLLVFYSKTLKSQKDSKVPTTGYRLIPTARLRNLL